MRDKTYIVENLRDETEVLTLITEQLITTCNSLLFDNCVTKNNATCRMYIQLGRNGLRKVQKKLEAFNTILNKRYLIGIENLEFFF